MFTKIVYGNLRFLKISSKVKFYFYRRSKRRVITWQFCLVSIVRKNYLLSCVQYLYFAFSGCFYEFYCSSNAHWLHIGLF